MRVCSTRYVDDYFYTRHADPLGDDLEPRLFVTSILLHASILSRDDVLALPKNLLRNLKPRANVSLFFKDRIKEITFVSFTKYSSFGLLGHQEYLRISTVKKQFTLAAKNTRSLVKSSSIITFKDTNPKLLRKAESGI